MNKYKVEYKRSNIFVDIDYIYAKDEFDAYNRFLEREEFEAIEIISVVIEDGL